MPAMYSIALHKKSNLSEISFRFLFLFFCFFTSFLHSSIVYSQTSSLCPKVNCTANDVTVVSTYLSGPNNLPINCNDAQPFLNAELHLIVSSIASRIGASISGAINL